MQARIKATGKEIIVEPYGDEYAQIFPDGDYKVYTKQELSFPNKIDWEQVRIDAAVKLTRALSEKMLGAGYSEKQIVKQAVELADALVAELQKKGGQDDSQ